MNWYSQILAAWLRRTGEILPAVRVSGIGGRWGPRYLVRRYEIRLSARGQPLARCSDQPLRGEWPSRKRWLAEERARQYPYPVIESTAGLTERDCRTVLAWLDRADRLNQQERDWIAALDTAEALSQL